jgi:hypothetical protein
MNNFVYQIWQIWNDNGDEFLIGTYHSKERAEKELDILEVNRFNKYLIRKERVI